MLVQVKGYRPQLHAIEAVCENDEPCDGMPECTTQSLAPSESTLCVDVGPLRQHVCEQRNEILGLSRHFCIRSAVTSMGQPAPLAMSQRSSCISLYCGGFSVRQLGVK